MLKRFLAWLFAPPAPPVYFVTLRGPRGSVTAEQCPTLHLARSRLRAAQRRRTASSGDISDDSGRVVDSF